MPKKSRDEAKSKTLMVTSAVDLDDIQCYHCQSPMVVEIGENGPFLRCTSRVCMRKVVMESQFPQVKCWSCGRNVTHHPNGPFGPFLSCTGYRDTKNRCDKTYSIKYVNMEALPPKLGPVTFPPTDEQANIIADAVAFPNLNMIVGALAGTGKTTLLRMLAYALGDAGQKNVLALAFNNKIARELYAAMPDWIPAMTWHRYGKEIIKKFNRRAWHNENKTKKIMAQYLPLPKKIKGIRWTQDEIEMARASGIQGYFVEQLVGLVKAYLYVTLMDDDDPQPTPQQLDEICANHGISVPVMYRDNIYRVTRLVVKESVDMWDVIDFDDMICIPALMPSIPDTFMYDTILCDEAQDLNRAQHILLQKLTRKRIIAVGDRNQAIYGFRGADVFSMQNLATLFGVEKEYPLTLTRRCGKAITAWAQQFVPDYRCADTVAEGHIEILDTLDPELMMPGRTMVLSRVNATLFRQANILIQRNVKVVIAGKDIGRDIRNLILSANADTIDELMAWLREYGAEVQAQLAKKKQQASNAQIKMADNIETIFYLCQGCNTIKDVLDRLDDLVIDTDKAGLPKDAVILTTAHSAKGLEAPVIIVADPEFFPHPRSKGNKPAMLQERNLCYVAGTRALEYLYFYRSMPKAEDFDTEAAVLVDIAEIME